MMPEYYSKINQDGDNCIYKNGELMFISLAVIGKRYFDRKIEDLGKRNIHVTDMD